MFDVMFYCFRQLCAFGAKNLATRVISAADLYLKGNLLQSVTAVVVVFYRHFLTLCQGRTFAIIVKIMGL